MNLAGRFRRWWLGAEYALLQDTATWLAARYFEDEKAVRLLRSEFDLQRAYLKDTGQLQTYNDYRARVGQQVAQAARAFHRF